jgi:hypothetical protein
MVHVDSRTERGYIPCRESVAASLAGGTRTPSVPACTMALAQALQRPDLQQQTSLLWEGSREAESQDLSDWKVLRTDEKRCCVFIYRCARHNTTTNGVPDTNVENPLRHKTDAAL